jgi:hypothetical protein
MKNSLFALALIFMAACSSNSIVLEIPAKQNVELDYSEFDYYTASVNNKSVKSINVSVLSNSDETQVRGFGLGPKGKDDVMVEKPNKLVIKNENEASVKVSINIQKTEAAPVAPKNNYVSLTLRNKTMKSIPLQIPSVMNPNLSPNSKSGVDLKMGQEIYFKTGAKKHLLLKVDDSLKDGQEIDVAALIVKRKEELGLK